VEATIRTIPDFPKPGIQFKDITPILQDPALFAKIIEVFVERYKAEKIDVVVGIESRGFIIGAALAYALGVGFVPIRKRGKLPFTTKQASYDLEYGSDQIEIHEDAVRPGQRVLLVDDLLATGGTMAAAVKLVKSLSDMVVGICFLIELTDLKGRDKLQGLPLYSLFRM